MADAPGDDGLWAGRSDLQEVVPGVFISNVFGASSKAKLLEAGITHVVNCGAELDCKFEGKGALAPGARPLVYLRVPLADQPSQRLPPHAADACAFIDAALHPGGAQGESAQGGGRVLVHCAGGGSRSAAVVIAYMLHAKARGTVSASSMSANGGGSEGSAALSSLGTVAGALAHLKNVRPVVAPNWGFLEQLAEFEHQLAAGAPAATAADVATAAAPSKAAHGASIGASMGASATISASASAGASAGVAAPTPLALDRPGAFGQRLAAARAPPSTSAGSRLTPLAASFQPSLHRDNRRRLLAAFVTARVRHSGGRTAGAAPIGAATSAATMDEPTTDVLLFKGGASVLRHETDHAPVGKPSLRSERLCRPRLPI